MTDAAAPDPREFRRAKVARRVRLPADRRTPAAARALVRSVLTDAELEELHDAALLLTTELSTNAVVHAGSDLELEVVADRNGLTVTVLDDVRGVITAGGRKAGEAAGTSLADLSDRGRGLLLVDHFANRWGTTHYQNGKGVWFRLNRSGEPEPPELRGELTDLAAIGPPAEVQAADTVLTALLEVTQDPYADDPLGEFAHSLLTRLADLIGAGGGVIHADLGEHGGPIVLARYGRPPRPGDPALRVPLTLGGGASGELELDSPPTSYLRPLAELVAERVALALENDRLRRADRRRQTWLTFLAEASELLAQSLDVELTMALIPQLVVPRLGEWSAVHTTDSWGRLNLEAAAHADEERLSELHAALQQTGPDTVLGRLPGALRGGQVPLPPPTEGLAIPLLARGQLLGTLSVGRHPDRRHEPDEVAVLQDVARRAALAVDNARIHAERRHVARTLQRSLLPPVLPVVDGLELAAAYVPTGDAVDVGGDFYDVVPLRDDRWLLAIGDVSGKGVQAATVTGLVREVIRALARGGRPLPEILERINETLVERGRGKFCTLALASVQRTEDGALTLTLHLAGHDRPLLLREDGRTLSAGSGGTALGLLETISCPAETVRLGPGDSLIFYTDGVTERRRGRELFGQQRLRDAVAPLAHYSAEVIAARLRTATIGFSSEPPLDDIAVLVLRNEPAPPPARGRARRQAPMIKESSA